MSRSQTTIAAAYEAYLEGRYWTLQFTADGMAKSLACFEHAIRLDPGYASPHGAIGERASVLASYLGVRPSAVVPAGIAAAERALQLNPESPEGYYARGILRSLWRHEWEDGLADIERAIELNPMYSAPNAFRAVWMVMHGRKAEALTQMEHAISLDPVNIYTRSSELWLLNAAGAHEKAVERAHALTAAFPANWASWFQAGVGFTGGRKLAEAESVLRHGLDLSPRNPNLLAMLALVAGRRGDLEMASRVKTQLNEISDQAYVQNYLKAVASLGSGDLESYYDLMGQALGERELGATAHMVSIRGILGSDPRFQALLKRVNLT